MLLSAEKLSIWELCPRRFIWTQKYGMPRISLVAALYRSVDAGLRSDKDPERAAENEFLALAASPGLDILGHDIYAIAMHHAKLAGIVSVALRSGSDGPWMPWGDTTLAGGHTWHSGCYNAGDGVARRVVLADRWGDDRKSQEMRSWRTLGEACALKQPIAVTAVTIGAAKDRRRISPWTRTYQHPKNRMYRFRRLSSEEDFSATWNRLWREDAGVSTTDWLTQMKKDDCMKEAVQTALCPAPPRRESYVREMQRYAIDMVRLEERVGDQPPMRLAGCYGFSPCIFLPVCHGAAPPVPENYGFRILPERVSRPDVAIDDTRNIPKDDAARRSPSSQTFACS